MKSPFRKNRNEIYYQLINSAMAGMLVFLGSLSNGFSWDGLFYGIIAALIVGMLKFKEYWVTQENEYKSSFLNLL